MVWDISSTLTSGSVPRDNNGNKSEKDVYLRNNKSNHEVGNFSP